MGTEGREKPIYSTRADDPALGETIETFVLHLAERIDALQDVEVKGEFASVAVLAGSLAAEAGPLGFDALARTAAALEELCSSDDSDGIHIRVVQLTEIARRIRLGHRGAV